MSTKRVDLIYDAVGSMSGINRFASTDQSVPVVNSNLTFDVANKLTGLTHARNAVTINSNGLTYDAAARVTQLTTVDGSSGYGYDATSQVTSANHSYQPSEAFSYDALGNRVGYVTTANNRLQSDGTFSYLYDDEGNRTQRTRISTGEVTSYTWDYRNRLTNVDTKTSGGVLTRSVAFKYDIFDRRIAKTIDLDGAGVGVAVTERYVYDRDHIMLVFVGSTLKERYLYGANLDQVLAVESTQVSWTLSDYLGTVRDLVSSAGVVQNHIKYDSFGNITAQSAPTVKSRFGFTGREFDSETGLYYYRSRYYDPVVGRFISEDRIGFAGGDANLSRYVFNSAVNGTDPFGLRPINLDEFHIISGLLELANKTERSDVKTSIDQGQGNPQDFARDLRKVAYDLQNYILQAKTPPEQDPDRIQAALHALNLALFYPEGYSTNTRVPNFGLNVREFSDKANKCNRFVGDVFAIGAGRRYGEDANGGTFPTYPASFTGAGYPPSATDLASPNKYIPGLLILTGGQQKIGDIISFDTSQHYNHPPLTDGHTGILLNYGLYVSAREGYTATKNGSFDGVQISRIPSNYPYTFRRFIP